MDGLVPHAVSPAPAGLGWDPGWAAAFAPFAGADRQPARVVAAHRDSWVLATPHGDRDAVLAGRHTTTHRALLRLPGGALLIDTPGIRSLGVAGAADGLRSAFADVEDIAAACHFTDCRHEREPGCEVRAALADGRLTAERMAGHRQLEREAAHAARGGDRLLREAERRRWKVIHAASREHMARKYGRET